MNGKGKSGDREDHTTTGLINELNTTASSSLSMLICMVFEHIPKNEAASTISNGKMLVCRARCSRCGQKLLGIYSAEKSSWIYLETE